MKYPIIFLFVSVLLATFVLLVLSFATFAEIKVFFARRASVGDLSAD